MPHKMFGRRAVEIADTLTVASGGAALAAWLTEIHLIVSIISGLIAIAAGLAALYYHLQNIKRLKSKDPQ